MIKVVKLMAALFLAILVMTTFAGPAFASYQPEVGTNASWGNQCTDDGACY